MTFFLQLCYNLKDMDEMTDIYFLTLKNVCN